MSNEKENTRFLDGQLGKKMMKLGAEKTIEDARKDIYSASRYLPEDEGYKLIESFEKSLRSKDYLIKKGY